MKKRLLHIMLLLALCFVLPACSDSIEEVKPDSSIKVSLGITARAVEQEGKEVGSGLPKSMKVWIYGVKDASETLLAYIEEKASNANPIFNDGTDIYGNPVEVIEQELEEGKKYNSLNFYVVLNDGAVTFLNSETLTKNTEVSILKNLTFTLSSANNDYDEDNEQLMYGESSLSINEYKTNYEIEIPVERSVAKLELYFSKNDGNKTLEVNEVKLVSKVAKGYLVEQESLDGNVIYGESETLPLFTSSDNSGLIGCTSIEDYGDFSADSEYFKRLVSAFLMENPSGIDWEEEETTYPFDGNSNVSDAYQVNIEYTYAGEVYNKSFYLPVVERNVLYKIFIRIRELDWEVDVFPYTGVILKPGFGL